MIMVSAGEIDRYEEEAFLRDRERPDRAVAVVPSWKGRRWLPLRPAAARTLYPLLEACPDVLSWRPATVRASFVVGDQPATFVPDVEVERRAETFHVHFLDAVGVRADVVRQAVRGMTGNGVRVMIVGPSLSEDRVTRRATGPFTLRGTIPDYADGRGLPAAGNDVRDAMERWLGRGGGDVWDFHRHLVDRGGEVPDGAAGAWLAEAFAGGRADVDLEADPATPVVFRAPGVHPRPSFDYLLRLHDATTEEPDDGLAFGP